MTVKPVRNFNKKVGRYSTIMNFLWNVEYELPQWVFMRILFRKRTKTDMWEGVKPDGFKPSIYRASERFASALTRQPQKIVQRMNKKLHEKQWKWADQEMKDYDNAE